MQGKFYNSEEFHHRFTERSDHKIAFLTTQKKQKTVQIQLIFKGYFNPILQFGVEDFSQNCAETGIDGLIIPT